MAAMVAVIMAAMVVVIMAVMVVVMVVVIMVVMAAILILMLLIPINLLVQKVGKIEVMEILLKTLNLKVEEVEEKEEFPTRVIPQLIKISTLFLQAY